MAFDRKCYDRLVELKLSNMVIDLLSEHETEELLNVKQSRTLIEYYLTCGPSVIYFFITNYNLRDITYLDSDLFFLSTPKVIYDEIGQLSIAITKHFLKNDPAGEFCVQFLFFRNDKDGLSALKWWRDRCIEWCYARYEDNRYADQKYLEYFPKLFNNVCIINNRGAGIAPWNMYNYEYINNTVNFNGSLYPLIFFHMHGTIFTNKGNQLILSTKNFDIKDNVRELFFNPYLSLILHVYRNLLGIDVEHAIIKERSIYAKVYSYIKHTLKTIGYVRYLVYKVMRVRNKSHECSKL
jgi:hypothetical protein